MSDNLNNTRFNITVGFADPDSKIGFGYVMKKMEPSVLLDQKAVELIDALYDRA